MFIYYLLILFVEYIESLIGDWTIRSYDCCSEFNNVWIVLVGEIIELAWDNTDELSGDKYSIEEIWSILDFVYF